MPVLFFADLDTLRLALASTAVPLRLGRTPVRFRYEAPGRLWLQPTEELARDDLANLARLGVQVQGQARPLADLAADWFRLVPAVPAPFPPPGKPPLLLDLPADQLPRVAGELRRLGHPAAAFRWLEPPGLDAGPHPFLRQENDAPLALAGAAEAVAVPVTRALLYAAALPYGTLARARAGGDDGPRLYYEQAPRVWLAAGYQHPLAEQLRPPTGRALVIAPDRDWAWLPDAPWRGELGSFALDEAPGRTSGAAGAPFRIAAATRRGSDEPAELWLLTERPRDVLAEWLSAGDDRLPNRFYVAWARSEGREVALLWARPGQPPPALVLPGAIALRPYLKLPNLFLPCGTALRPSLRRDLIRQRLAPDPRRLVWLTPADGGFRIGTLPRTAFRSLVELTSYVAPSTAPAALVWEPAGALEPAAFRTRVEPKRVAPPVEMTPLPQLETTPAPAGPGIIARAAEWLRRRLRAAEGEPETTAAPPADHVTHSGPDGERLPAPLVELRRVQEELEDRFRDSARPSDAEDRRELWPRLASVYAEQNRHADASLCWLNALWEQLLPSLELADAWRLAEARGRREALTDASRWYSAATAPGGARGLAAQLVYAAAAPTPPLGLTERLPELHRELDAAEPALPARAAWLARLALAKLAGGDLLGLARARDRLHDRLLHQGLRLDLDLPRFTRFSGTGAGERGREIASWLLRARPLLQRWLAGLASPRAGQPAARRLQYFGLEAETRCTARYLDLTLAWGLARLGETRTAAELAEPAAKFLAGVDPVHALLVDAYRYRLTQAADGLLPTDPLPAALLARLAHLNTHDRYVVSRLRERSRLLEPAPGIDAFRDGVLRPAASDPYHPANLPRKLRALLQAGRTELTRPGTLSVTVTRALQQAASLGEQLTRLTLDAVPAALARLSAKPDEQARLLEQALAASAHYADADAVARLVPHIVAVLENPHGPEAAFEPLTGEYCRDLRRLGRSSELEELLKHTAAWLRRHDPAELRKNQPALYPVVLRTSLHLAAAWFYLGREAKAKEIITAAAVQLYDPNGRLEARDQTTLAKAYASALGQAPRGLALGRLEEMFQRLQGVHTQGTTNSHYNLAAVELVEAVVRAVVHEDFLLGPGVRRWRDDDEFLVRRRIRRDLTALLAGI